MNPNQEGNGMAETKRFDPVGAWGLEGVATVTAGFVLGQLLGTWAIPIALAAGALASMIRRRAR
jgi:hypothetical protein